MAGEGFASSYKITQIFINLNLLNSFSNILCAAKWHSVKSNMLLINMFLIICWKIGCKCISEVWYHNTDPTFWFIHVSKNNNATATSFFFFNPAQAWKAKQDSAVKNYEQSEIVFIKS